MPKGQMPKGHRSGKVQEKGTSESLVTLLSTGKSR
jgi:hypothetical protein